MLRARPPRSSRFPVLCAALLGAMSLAACRPSGDAPRTKGDPVLDSIAQAHVAFDMVPGVSVAVVQGADTLLWGGYGFADLELEVPTLPEYSYEIGSVTKQFTAVAVLQLVEQGLIDLDAEVSTYLPEYDPDGRTVTVARLLDHSSGIRSYTEMQVFGDLVTRELPRDSLVELVEQEPFDFEPGTAAIYNNSAYFMLGLIVAKVSGQPYEDYVEEHLFGPLGMEDSYYCEETAVVKGKAHGYDGSPEGLSQKGWLDHTWPYAAGSLCSTVGDLVTWTRAVHSGDLLEPGSYEALITPVPLIDGTPRRYAMGLTNTHTQGLDGGHVSISHGGGINGFLSQLSYYPDGDLIVAVLQNSTAPQGPGLLADALAEAVLGPGAEPTRVDYPGALEELVGVYAGPARGRPITVPVQVVDGSLVVNAGTPGETRPFYTGQEGVWSDGPTLFRFVPGANGGVVELRIDAVAGHYRLQRTED